MELRFLRDTDGREVDFDETSEAVVYSRVQDRKARSVSSRYFERTQIPRFYQVTWAKKNTNLKGIRIALYSFCQMKKCRELYGGQSAPSRAVIQIRQ